MPPRTLSDTEQARHELLSLIDTFPKGLVWRDLFDVNGALLCKGIGEPEDGVDLVMNGLNLHGKSVLDLGCNAGHNAFLAIQHGARHVVGVDCDPRVIKCAELMARHHGYSATQFITADIRKAEHVAEMSTVPSFDTLLLIDIIGKHTIRKGELPLLLQALKQYDCQEIILTARPYYRFRKHFGMSKEEFLEVNPSRHVAERRYHCTLDIVEEMKPAWKLATPYKQEWDKHSVSKKALVFHRA